MLSFLKSALLAGIGFFIFFILLFIAMATKSDTLMIIAFVWLFAMWPIIGLIQIFF